MLSASRVVSEWRSVCHILLAIGPGERNDAPLGLWIRVRADRAPAHAPHQVSGQQLGRWRMGGCGER